MPKVAQQKPLGKKAFIYENPNTDKIRLVLSTLVFFCLLVGLGFLSYFLFKDTQPMQTFVNFLFVDSRNLFKPNTMEVFYISLIGYLFFIPLPIVELLFYRGLLAGNPVVLSTVLVFLAIFISQVFNYVVGMYLSPFFIHFINKKTLYKVRRWVNTYGVYGIVILNALPLPSPILTFSLGIIHANTLRLFFYIFVGATIKYGTIILFYFVTQWLR
ncbi:MAG: hypothetical protein ACMXYC_03410 [Candidatus Woesearchaeota archaeon]